MNKNIRCKLVILNNIIIFKIIIIFINYILYSFIYNLVTDKNNYKNNVFSNSIIVKLIKNDINLDIKICNYIKDKLKKRKRPFDYETEFFFLHH